MKEQQKRTEKPTGVPVSNIPALFRHSAGVIQMSNSAHMNIFSNLYFMFLSTNCCIVSTMSYNLSP